jgi:hypothetical protein
MNPVLKNIVRTAVPSVVGAVASVIAKAKANLTPSETAILFPIVTTAYYSLIRTLETKYPKLSWLLGALPVKATDAPAPAPAQATVTASATATVETPPTTPAA